MPYSFHIYSKKDLNLLKKYIKHQEVGSLLKVFFALSKWPHFHRAYLVTVPKRMSIAVHQAMVFVSCLYKHIGHWWPMPKPYIQLSSNKTAHSLNTANPQKRPAGLIFFRSPQVQVLLDVRRRVLLMKSKRPHFILQLYLVIF